MADDSDGGPGGTTGLSQGGRRRGTVAEEPSQGAVAGRPSQRGRRRGAVAGAQRSQVRSLPVPFEHPREHTRHTPKQRLQQKHGS